MRRSSTGTALDAATRAAADAEGRAALATEERDEARRERNTALEQRDRAREHAKLLGETVQFVGREQDKLKRDKVLLDRTNRQLQRDGAQVVAAARQESADELARVRQERDSAVEAASANERGHGGHARATGRSPQPCPDGEGRVGDANDRAGRRRCRGREGEDPTGRSGSIASFGCCGISNLGVRSWRGLQVGAASRRGGWCRRSSAAPAASTGEETGGYVGPVRAGVAAHSAATPAGAGGARGLGGGRHSRPNPPLCPLSGAVPRRFYGPARIGPRVG